MNIEEYDALSERDKDCWRRHWLQNREELERKEIAAAKKRDKVRALYENFMEAHLERPTEINEQIKHVKVKYEDVCFEIAFNRPDIRHYTSPENGYLGGRPRGDNPSPHALYLREWRERKNAALTAAQSQSQTELG